MAFEQLGIWLVANIAVLYLLILWSAVWKLIALWKCGRNNQLVWFIVIGIINSAGILPIVYLAFFQKKAKKKKK